VPESIPEIYFSGDTEYDRRLDFLGEEAGSAERKNLKLGQFKKKK
jgi:hypothetical protein